MAVNLGWVLEQREDSGPVFVFAHDMHVEKGSGQPRMGSFLAARGTRVLTIGTVDALRPGGGASPAGAPQGPDGVGAVCADVGLPAFVVDLRQVPPSGPVHDWLAQPRLVNPVALASSQPYAIHALDWFDALIFVRALTYGR